MDAILLALIAVSAIYIKGTIYRNFYFVPLFIGGNFFLFCSVFRCGPKLEPLWMDWLFLSLYILILFEWPFPNAWLGLSTLGSFIIVLYAIKSSSYEGICYYYKAQKVTLRRTKNWINILSNIECSTTHIVLNKYNN